MPLEVGYGISTWHFEALAVGLVSWLAASTWVKLKTWRDGKRIYDWLKENTRDEGESHKSLLEICDGVRLSEERVKRACTANRKIYRSFREADTYSVWRQEQRSIYESSETAVM